ncbi:farnesol dehydrogenase-like [Rhynchophorus ferrugineus]|uniref:farnesol dehydrogenase-like n=1 Tax=Rhynchophorus ferrugineus TaxID=354439 RepID=UPI003FCD8B49
MSMDRWIGKVAVVTGASVGIGKAIAEALVKNGVIVAGIARRVHYVEEHAETLKNERGKLHAFKCDLTKDQEILATFKKITDTLGPIHILINNAGLALQTELIGGDISKWKQIIDTNLFGVTVCTREAINSMIQSNIKGHIVNINSITGHMIFDIPGLSVYPATKYAITALSECLRLEINRSKLPIKMTSLSPGYVKSDFFTNASLTEIKDFQVDRPGLETKDIADAVIYVLSTPEHVNIKELTLTIQGLLH